MRKRRILIKVLLANVLLYSAHVGMYYNLREKPVVETLTYEQITASISSEKPEIETFVVTADAHRPVRPKPAAELPKEVLLDVPFTSQAPYNDWSMPYQEACEEASVLMVAAYQQGFSLTADIADKKIVAVTDWVQRSQLYTSLNASEVAVVAEHYFGLKLKRRTDVTVDSIKRELAAGRPVIIPAAGRLLGNPYFRGIGPAYHMLVITGYNETSFITNDPGTIMGYKFSYDQQVLLDAIHDWTGSENTMTSGEKVMLTLE